MRDHFNTNSSPVLNENLIRYGKPKESNGAIIKDLVNNNYQIQFLQQQKQRETSFQKNLEEIMSRLRNQKERQYEKHLQKMTRA